MLHRFNEFLLENKMWGKSIIELLNWLDQKSDKYWVVTDTETTGLPSDPYEVQLTQVSGLAVKYNSELNQFDEQGYFDKKIKLTSKTKELLKTPTRIRKVLSFNHYGNKAATYYEEAEILEEFHDFLDQWDNPILVIQNAPFDMRFLNTRHPNLKFTNEVIDTKDIIQLYYLPALQTLAQTEIWAKNLVNKIGTSDRDNGLISSSLSKIGPALGLNMTGYHDALTDCRLAMQMLQKIVYFLKEHQSLDIKKYQAERILTKK
jgi:DNA polymerase III epsilon subunit-like protein